MQPGNELSRQRAYVEMKPEVKKHDIVVVTAYLPKQKQKTSHKIKADFALADSENHRIP